jgi:hypothetical protein
MRIKLIVIATAIAALAIGVGTSSATLNSSTSATLNVSKPGGPGTVKLVIDNTDNQVVPQRISEIQISSKFAKWNAKAVPQCKSEVPTNANGKNNAGQISPACPSGSKVGTGKFTVNTGTPGQPIPSDLGTISGDVNIYNYTPQSGTQATLLIEILSDIPVPNAHQYQLAKISKSGTIDTFVPLMEDLPPAVKNILSPPSAPRTVSLSHFETTIKSKGKKPFFTIKQNKKLDFNVTLIRDNQ